MHLAGLVRPRIVPRGRIATASDRTLPPHIPDKRAPLSPTDPKRGCFKIPAYTAARRVVCAGRRTVAATYGSQAPPVPGKKVQKFVSLGGQFAVRGREAALNAAHPSWAASELSASRRASDEMQVWGWFFQKPPPAYSPLVSPTSHSPFLIFTQNPHISPAKSHPSSPATPAAPLNKLPTLNSPSFTRLWISYLFPYLPPFFPPFVPCRRQGVARGGKGLSVVFHRSHSPYY